MVQRCIAFGVNMKKEQIAFLKSLDPDGKDGTIQAMLMNPNITAEPFDQVAKALLLQLMIEKNFLVKQNIQVIGMIQDNRAFNKLVLGDDSE